MRLRLPRATELDLFGVEDAVPALAPLVNEFELPGGTLDGSPGVLANSSGNINRCSPNRFIPYPHGCVFSAFGKSQGLGVQWSGPASPDLATLLCLDVHLELSWLWAQTRAQPFIADSRSPVQFELALTTPIDSRPRLEQH